MAKKFGDTHGRYAKNPRSTGRKRGRATLIRTRRPFICDESNGHGCGRGPSTFPDSYPENYRDEALLASPEKRVEDLTLQCNHINKNILDNDPANLEWLCPSCHYNTDRQTEKGVSIIDDEFGYGQQYW